jgi:aminoglycoside 6-adenylyltransferase
LFSVKLSLDHIMKFQCLRKMMEWHLEIEQNWSVKLGADGKRLKKQVEQALWTELDNTYVSAGIEKNWDALFNTIYLFRKVAREVGDRLGYPYPDDIDRGGIKFLNRVKGLKNYNKLL